MMPTAENQWTARWKHWVGPTRFPGVNGLQEGGCLVRTRVANPMIGKPAEQSRL